MTAWDWLWVLSASIVLLAALIALVITKLIPYLHRWGLMYDGKTLFERWHE